MQPSAQDLRACSIPVLEAGPEPPGALAARCGVRGAFVEQRGPRGRRRGSRAAQPHAGGRPRALRRPRLTPGPMRRGGPRWDAGGAPWGGDGAGQGALGRCWGRASLGPPRPPGALGRGEQLAAPTGAGRAELLPGRGARLVPFAPDAPAGNPLEPGWSQRQTSWRRAQARTVDALCDASTQARDTSTEADMRGWLTHGGYARQ
jgi:hypothetical protein